MQPTRQLQKSETIATDSLLYLLALIISICFTACEKSVSHEKFEQPVVTTSPASQAASPTPDAKLTPDATPALKPPGPAEVQGAVARVYGNAVIVNTSGSSGFITGDFNGDGSEDIAVVAKPAKGKLEDLNSELANWILEDPRQVMQSDALRAVQPAAKTPEPLKVKQGDLLLIIIHGYKQDGWRNSQAKQSYLLGNSVGNMMTAQPIKELQNLIGNRARLPRQDGDIIRETLSGEPGFIYWTGAKYSWHQMAHKPVG